MTTLTEALKVAPPTHPCPTGKWLNSLSEDDRKAVVTAVRNPEWSTSQLWSTLREYGLPCSRETLGTHRKGLCRHCGTI